MGTRETDTLDGFVAALRDKDRAMEFISRSTISKHELLHCAAAEGDAEVTGHLIDQGADPKRKNEAGDLPLHHAVKKGDFDTCKVILERAGNQAAAMASSANDRGHSPMYLTIVHNRPRICKLMIVHGVNLNAKIEGVTLLGHAIMQKKEHFLARFLKNGADPNGIDGHRPRQPRFRRPLHIAAQTGVGVQKLVDAGAGINYRDDPGNLPLYYTVARKGSIEEARALSNKVRFDHRHDFDILNHACARNDIAMCELLVDSGMKVNTEFSATQALHVAALTASKELCEWLINRGARLDAQNSYGRTALHLAAMFGRTDICKLLVSKGASIRLKDVSGLVPQFLAINNGRRETCAMFSGISIETLYCGIQFAIQDGLKQMFEFMTENIGHMINMKREDMTLLHWAALYDRPDFCKSLLAKGANDALADANNRIPLCTAIEKNHTDVCNILLDHSCALQSKYACLTALFGLYHSLKHSHKAMTKVVLAKIPHLSEIVDSEQRDNLNQLYKWILMTATSVYDHESFEALFDKGVYAIDKEFSFSTDTFMNCYNLLNYAAHIKNFQTFKFLLSRNAKVKEKSESTFYMAISDGINVPQSWTAGGHDCEVYRDAWKKLNRKQAINILTHILDHETRKIGDLDRVLDRVIETDFVEVVVLFMERGIEFSVSQKVTIMAWAIEKSHAEVFGKLINDASVREWISNRAPGCERIFLNAAANDAIADSVFALVPNEFALAAELGLLERCKKCSPQEMREKVTNDPSILETVIRNGHGAVLELLLENKVSVNTVVSVSDAKAPLQKCSLLLLAVKNNMLSICEVLHRHGVDLGGAEEQPLCIAVSNNYFEIVEFLLKIGVNDATEKNSFLMAAQRGNTKMCELMLNFARRRDVIASFKANCRFDTKPAKATGSCGMCNGRFFTEWTSTDCGHMFHSRCARGLLVVGSSDTVTCPICGKGLSAREILQRLTREPRPSEQQRRRTVRFADP